MTEIQIKMSINDKQILRNLLISYRKDRAGEREFEEFIDGLIHNTFETTMKISKLLKEN